MPDGETMRALFPPWTNTVVRLVLLVLALAIVGALAGLLTFVRSPLFTGQLQPVTQPIQFDHRHHVGDDGIDCRYCHETVETAASAGFPATEVCMSCHAQIWNQSPLLATVRASYFTGRPLVWRRVYELPDFVYFNHSIHVNKGVGCVTCHGRVDRMPEVMKVASLSMQWCLDCHRDPAPHLRPRRFITDLAWATDEPVSVGRQVAKENHVQTRTSCTACHR